MNDREDFERCWPWLDASLASFGRAHGATGIIRVRAQSRARASA